MIHIYMYIYIYIYIYIYVYYYYNIINILYIMPSQFYDFITPKNMRFINKLDFYTNV